ncbi:hypothetical protein HRbin36_01547 [bacterium HR36]|nr:hypothetical protein HRbin36_01547 [bacterium HR36]
MERAAHSQPRVLGRVRTLKENERSFALATPNAQTGRVAPRHAELL